MNATELKIHVLARILADLKIPDPVQRRETIERTLISLVKYAMMRREIEQFHEMLADMRRVEEIRTASKQNI